MLRQELRSSYLTTVHRQILSTALPPVYSDRYQPPVSLSYGTLHCHREGKDKRGPDFLADIENVPTCVSIFAVYLGANIPEDFLVLGVTFCTFLPSSRGWRGGFSFLWFACNVLPRV